MNERFVSWEGCRNVRDLGGLRTQDGRTTHMGAVVRSDTPGRLTPAGWQALYAYGIRTIVTLRTHGMQEPELDYDVPYADLARVQAPIEDVNDEDFLKQWAESGLWSTPLYYPDALQRWPQRHVAVISAIARSQPGGVLFHCIRGHDRTGIISLLLLSLAGVLPEEILADYQLSPDPEREQILAGRGTSVPQVILGTLSGFDVEANLLGGGATRADLAAVRRRLVG
jgi:hypothetical protein